MDDQPDGYPGKASEQQRSSRATIGCGIVAAALAIGLVAFIVTDAITPCGSGLPDCDGNSDAAAMDNFHAALVGGLAFIVSLAAISLVALLIQSLRQKPGQQDSR